MSKTTPVLHAFNTGTFSRAGLARIDHEKTRLAAEIQENLLPYVIGKALFRPGSGYLGASAFNNQAKYIKFVKAVDDTALLELTDLKLRVWVDDVLVTRPAVTSAVTNGDFSLSTGWTLATSGGAVADINSTVANALWLAAPYRGGIASCTRSVTTSSAGTEHALRITVTRGPITFRCGSTSGGDDYIEETILETGIHSLAFTPSGTYHVYFSSRREAGVIVDSIQVESAGVMEITAPWTTAQLREIRYDQSGDQVFLAHGSWQQRIIEKRHARRSWSLVLYKSDDGPFMTSPSSKVRLTPGATQGNTTLTSDAAFFRPEHVGCLFRLDHSTFLATFGLGGADQYTDAIRVNGIGVDNDFAYTLGGTWSGTIRLWRSYESRVSGFVNTLTSYTTNATGIPFAPGADFNNITHFYRLGFGSTTYTSGAADVTIQYNGDSGFGICQVTSYTSPTQVGIEVLSDFKHTKATADWREGEWSDRRGWPTAVAFFDGRLGWTRDDQTWLSESDDYYAFNLETEGDAASIQRNIATGGSVNRTNAMLALQRLFFLTDGSESSARASTQDQPLTANAITIKDASTQGSASVAPIKVDGRGIFVQRAGSKLFELVYNFEANDYTSDDLTDFNETIGGSGIVAIDVQRQPQTYIWGIRADGTVAILLYAPRKKVLGWVDVLSPGASGEVEDVVVLPAVGEDRVYLSVKRTVLGSTVRYLEKLALHSEAIGGTITKLADAGLYTAAASTAVTAAHLAGQTGLIGWGISTADAPTVLTGLSASSAAGVIDLGASYSNSWVGLSYGWRYKSAKLAYGGDGTALMQKKEVKTIGLLLENTHKDAIKVGPSFATADLSKFLLKSNSGQLLTGVNVVKAIHDDVAQPFGARWDTDARVHMTGEAGHPACLLGLLIGMETNSK